MAFYRVSRNLEASLIDFLKQELEEENWTNISVEKSFARAYSLAMNMNNGAAVLCIRASDTNRTRAEIGTDNVMRSELILIDVFATNDGQRLDLVDFILDELKSGFPYYQYQTGPNNVESRIQDGRCTIKNMEDRPVNFNIDKSSLELQDRYRHLISLQVATGKVE